MQVNHRSRAPVMILGHGRSGTSILSRLFRNYLGVAFGTESQFIVRYFRMLGRYGDLHDDRNLSRLVRHITTERWFRRSRKFGFETTPEAILEDVRERTYRGVLDAVFLQLAKQLGMARWGDKAPDYALDLDVIGGLFPDAQYVHIVRDGRDVALSVMEMPWGANNLFTAAVRWKQSVRLIDDFLARLPERQRLTITYEGLLSDPVGTFSQIIPFLDIDDSDGALLRHVSDHLPGDLNRANFDKWRSRFSPTERARFERVAGDLLREHGYETATDKVWSRPPVVRRAFWACHGKACQWARPGHWRDNVYKVRLRGADALRRLASAFTKRPGPESGGPSAG